MQILQLLCIDADAILPKAGRNSGKQEFSLPTTPVVVYVYGTSIALEHGEHTVFEMFPSFLFHYILRHV